MLKKNSKMSL